MLVFVVLAAFTAFGVLAGGFFFSSSELSNSFFDGVLLCRVVIPGKVYITHNFSQHKTLLLKWALAKRQTKSSFQIWIPVETCFLRSLLSKDFERERVVIAKENSVSVGCCIILFLNYR